VADIDMYSEFSITMTIPAVGLLLIFLFYQGWLWRIKGASKWSAAAVESNEDAETGTLQTDTAGHAAGELEDADVMATRGARDLCVWLAIGWLFLVLRIRRYILQKCNWQLLC
jgi:hypothetical protein